MEIAEQFITRRVTELTKKDVCKDCYLKNYIKEQFEEEDCPFRFIEECCDRFKRKYDIIYKRESKRKWEEILEFVDNDYDKPFEYKTVRDPETITQQEIDEIINIACEKQDKIADEKYVHYLKNKQDKLLAIISEGTPRDDTSRAHEYLHALDGDNEVYIRFAIESIGFMARRHGAEFIELIGIYPKLKEVLQKNSTNNRIINALSMAFTEIALNGGAGHLLSNNITETLVDIIRNKDISFITRKECAKAVGFIYSMFLLEEN